MQTGTFNLFTAKTLRHGFFVSVSLCLFLSFVACSSDDESTTGHTPADEYKGMPLVIYDTDLGSSTDDLFALMMLYRYSDLGLCKLLGVVVDRPGEDNAALADVMNTYYGYPDVPIGLVQDGVWNTTVWIDYHDLPSYADADGRLLLRRSVQDLGSLPDGWKLYRRLLASQMDHSVSICSVGFVTCLAQLLESGADEYSSLSGVELVRRKVKCCYIMGGQFGENPLPEYNFEQDPKSAQTFFRLWPSDVDLMFSPAEVGDSIEYMREDVIADIPWTDRHPIKQVYLRCNVDTGQMMWDPLAVIQAVEGDGHFMLSGRGTVTLTSDARTIFSPSPTGNCRYQLPGTMEWNLDKLDLIRLLNRVR